METAWTWDIVHRLTVEQLDEKEMDVKDPAAESQSLCSSLIATSSNWERTRLAGKGNASAVESEALLRLCNCNLIMPVLRTANSATAATLILNNLL